MGLHEIVLPETKPETEWVRGRALQKVSPTYPHGFLQARIAAVLLSWARGKGRVATEWRFRVMPPDSYRRPLVPDVAFLSRERVLSLPAAELDVPTVAPDLAVEVLSPDDRIADVDAKCAVYLAAGTRAVLLVDPYRRYAEARLPETTLHFGAAGTIAIPGFDGLSISLAELFAELDAPL
jgi:Uma2 family endonuclease